MKRKIYIIASLSAIIFLSAFIISNFGIAGIYESSLVKRSYKNSDSYLAFKDGKVYAVDFNDDVGISILDYGSYSIEDSEILYEGPLGQTPSNIQVSFTKITWPLYTAELSKYTKTKSQSELGRVFNPIKKIHFNYTICKHENKSLISFLKFW